MIFLKQRRTHFQIISISGGKKFILSSLFVGILLATGANAETRKLKLYYLHTGEKRTIEFKKNNLFLPDGLKKVNYFLRDWRHNEPTKMDPHLLDLIWEIYRQSGSKSYIHVISGYRSPATNGMLRKRGHGVARKSQHMLGKAMDFFLPDVKLAKLRKIGLIKQLGGVGYYPRSGSPFVHIDTGNVRHWPRMTRKELVKVFPHGGTLHIPTNGQPLPGYKLALANYNARKLSGKKTLLAKNIASKPKNFFQRLASLRKKDKKSVNLPTPSGEKPLPKESATKLVLAHDAPPEKQPQSEVLKIANVPIPIILETVLKRPDKTNDNADNIVLVQSDNQNQATSLHKETGSKKTNFTNAVVPFVRPEFSSTLVASSETIVSPLVPAKTDNTILASNNDLLTLSTSRKLRAQLIAQADNQVKANQTKSSDIKGNLKIALLRQQSDIVIPSKKPGIRSLMQTASIAFKPVNAQSQKNNSSLSDLALAFVQENVSRDVSLIKLRAMIKQQNLKLAHEYAKKDSVALEDAAGETSRKVLLSSLTTIGFPTTSLRQRKIKKTIVQSSPKTVSGQFQSSITADIVMPLIKPGRHSGLSAQPQIHKKPINQISKFMLASNAGSEIADKMRPPVYGKAIIRHVSDMTTATRFVSSKSKELQNLVRLN